jgi:hypothetical protein
VLFNELSLKPGVPVLGGLEDDRPLLTGVFVD